MYYWAGNFLFAVNVYIFLMMAFDRSLYHLAALKRDISDAEQNRFYQLPEYLYRFKNGYIDNIYDSKKVKKAVFRNQLKDGNIIIQENKESVRIVEG